MTGLKRSILPIRLPPSKRFRTGNAEEAGDTDTEHSVASDAHNEDSDEELETPVTTPARSGNATPDLRPCRQKRHNCTFPNCDKVFVRQSRLLEHVRSHTNSRVFGCPHAGCEKDFLRETHLQRHIKSAHTGVRDCVCTFEGCGKAFSTNSRLKRHEQAHEAKENKTCPHQGCGQIFRKHATLQKHVTEVHEQKPYFVCQEVTQDGMPCEQGFRQRNQLKLHRQRVHGMDKFQCLLCSESLQVQEHQTTEEFETSFPTYRELMHHIDLAHPPTCSTCQFQCSSQRQLTQHIDIEHGNVATASAKTHSCPELGCGRMFTKKGNLNIHIQTVHKNEKNFVCGGFEFDKLCTVPQWDTSLACGRSFTTKGNLEQHIRSIHLKYGTTSKAKASPPEPNAKSSLNQKTGTKSSLLHRLTGTAYAENSSRQILCLQDNCEFRFERFYDRDLHLQVKHGLADFEIQLLEAERSSGRKAYGIDDRSQHNTFGSGVERSKEDIEAERVFDEHFRPNMNKRSTSEHDEESAVEMKLQAAAQSGGAFWIGGREDDLMEQDGEDEWDADEMEMRQLIESDDDDDNDDNDNNDETRSLNVDSNKIDPYLR